MREAADQARVYDSGVGSVAHEFARGGVAKRVEELYTAHERLVRSICRSLLRDRTEAEDAAQQTFLSAQRALANGSAPREPAAWLATIARNECLSRVRERMREPLPVDAEPTEFGIDAHSAAVSRYEVATLREALADLPRLQREAILLREFRGLSYDEVAHAMSVTTGAVESLIFRARRTLQVKLSEALPAFSPLAFLGRLLGSGGGDIAAPVVKVAAIGIGAAVLAGGAAFGPGAFGLGHTAAKTHRAPSSTHVQAASSASSISSAHIWSGLAPAPSAPPPATQQPEREAAASGPTTSDVAETTAPETSGSGSSTPERETEAATTPTSTTPSTNPPPPTSSGSGDPAGTDGSSGASEDPPGTDS